MKKIIILFLSISFLSLFIIFNIFFSEKEKISEENLIENFSGKKTEILIVFDKNFIDLSKENELEKAINFGKNNSLEYKSFLKKINMVNFLISSKKENLEKDIENLNEKSEVKSVQLNNKYYLK